jgi:hypothetical protein
MSALKNLDRRDFNLVPGCENTRNVCTTDVPDHVGGAAVGPLH